MAKRQKDEAEWKADWQAQMEKSEPAWKERVQESKIALSKVKPRTIPFAKAKRFVPQAKSIAVLMLRKEDGSQIVDGLVGFTFLRDQQNKLAWSIFKKWKPRLYRVPVLRNWFTDKVRRLYNIELAIPFGAGWFSAHDASTFEQIPFTQNKDLVSLFHKLDRELTGTTQGLVIANTEAERIKNKGSWIEKYGTQILLFIAMVLLAIALIQLGSDISGLKVQIAQIGSSISNLPGSIVGKIANGTG
jgi:hypothetical protein